LIERIRQGGTIVLPILAVAALAVLIIFERTVFLWRTHVNADGFAQRLNALIGQGEWKESADICRALGRKPVPRVLLAGIQVKDMGREHMENALQEAILGEIPRLERFLSTLGILAAIAPLLGLLGTVTGMINTFHTITLYGTGDPRMMSGGISEALITTMLGLAVAIPVMLCHTVLSRAVENTIGQMEEKAVAFVNTVFKTRKV
ncbi:MotA/TolQ/ExbB proton channel family protein, partial [Thermodesulfobacteriota bacterium]